MKRTIAMGMVVLLLLSMSACGNQNKQVEATATTTTTATSTGKPATSSAIEEQELPLSYDEALSKANDVLKTMTLDEKIGQMFIVNLEQLDTSKGTYHEFVKVTKKMKQTLSRYGVGGVILFSRNIATREQTVKLINKLQASSKYPLYISVDEEGGTVSRIASNANMKTTVFPSMEEVGKLNDPDYVYSMGKTIGSQIKELGFNLNFAPVADVKTTVTNAEIGTRSFGYDEDVVATMVENCVKGMQDSGISATLKHFPGQGSAEGDTHKGSVNINTSLMTLRDVDFVPFQSGIDAGVDMVMMSHISVSKVTTNTVPASLSSTIIEDILRDELGFDGVVITDAMNMTPITSQYKPGEAAVLAVQAGIDIVLEPADFTKAFNSVKLAVESKKIPESVIDDSVLRILTAKIRRGLDFTQ